MTAKEKKEQLINKYLKLSIGICDDLNDTIILGTMCMDSAILCAIKEVEDSLNLLIRIPEQQSLAIKWEIMFLNDVIKELEK